MNEPNDVEKIGLDILQQIILDQAALIEKQAAMVVTLTASGRELSSRLAKWISDVEIRMAKVEIRMAKLEARLEQ